MGQLPLLLWVYTHLWSHQTIRNFIIPCIVVIHVWAVLHFGCHFLKDGDILMKKDKFWRYIYLSPEWLQIHRVLLENEKKIKFVKCTQVEVIIVMQSCPLPYTMYNHVLVVFLSSQMEYTYQKGIILFILSVLFFVIYWATP